MSLYKKNYLILGILCISSFLILSFLLFSQFLTFSEYLIQFDQLYYNHISLLYQHNSLEFNTFMILLTLFGREFFWLVIFLLFFIFARRFGRKTVLVTIISLLIVVPITYVSKDIFDRTRPNESNSLSLLNKEESSSFSYPSGHASFVTSSALSFFLVYRGSNFKFFISVILLLEAFLVSFSRIYVGVHYPLDVLGGVLLGIGVSFIVVSQIKKLEYMFNFITTRK